MKKKYTEKDLQKVRSILQKEIDKRYNYDLNQQNNEWFDYGWYGGLFTAFLCAGGLSTLFGFMFRHISLFVLGFVFLFYALVYLIQGQNLIK